MCLRYLTAEDTKETRALAFEQFRSADNMTDKIGGLAPLADMDGEERDAALQSVLRAVESQSARHRQMDERAGDLLPARHAVRRLKRLTKHPAFNDRKSESRPFVGRRRL